MWLEQCEIQETCLKLVSPANLFALSGSGLSCTCHIPCFWLMLTHSKHLETIFLNEWIQPSIMQVDLTLIGIFNSMYFNSPQLDKTFFGSRNLWKRRLRCYKLRNEDSLNSPKPP